ncbi:MAG: YlbF family regulator, partial [Ruminococcus sp.]|nr:YlbF family regulator [Ruminococcus sp.]
MDIIEMTRELGKALQNDDRFIAYSLAKQANDNDAELQKLISDFEQMRSDLTAELCKEDKDTDRVKELDEGIKSNYKKIMENRNMI